MKRQVYQEESDRELVGNLTDIGGMDRIEKFRALREPAGETIPLLRCEVDRPNPTPPGDATHTIFPIATIPYNEGACHRTVHMVL